MTLLRPLDYAVGPSQFPPARASAAEQALFANPKISHRFVPEALGVGGNRWPSIKRLDQADPASRGVFSLVDGYDMPVYTPGADPTAPNGEPFVVWPVGKRAIFRGDNIVVPTDVEKSFTIAAVYRPKTNAGTSFGDGLLAATLGTRNTTGITAWGWTDEPGSYYQRYAASFTSVRTGESNLPGTNFDDGAGRDWTAIIWTRRGVLGANAQLKTYYAHTVGGQMVWGETVTTATSIGALNSTLMLGGSHEVGDTTAYDGLSTSWDMAIADLIIMEDHDVIDDATTLAQLGDLWFPKFFGA